VRSAHERHILNKEPEILAEPSRMLLNSYKIRRTGWRMMTRDGNSRAYRSQLQPDAVSSEANTPPVEGMPAKVLAEEVFFHKYTTIKNLAVPNTIDIERLLDLATQIEVANHASEWLDCGWSRPMYYYI
jgi:hypothetical protein